VARDKLARALLCGVVSSVLSTGGLAGERPAVVDAPPATALFFSCDIKGRLAPFACEEGQLGGVARMATIYHQWQKDCPHGIIVDVGNATVGGREDGATINGFVFEALDRLGCAVVNCGENEASLSGERLVELAQGRSFATISANLVRADSGKNVLPAYHIVRRGDVRVAFIGLVGDDIPPQRLGRGLRLVEPRRALEAALGELQGRADVIIVLAHLSPGRMYAVASRHPRVHMVLGGRAPATSAPFELVDRVIVAYLGDEGCTVGRLDAAFPPAHRPKVVGRVALLSEDIAEDEGMRPLVARFRAAVGDGLLPGANWDPKMPCTSSYVGSEVCKLCHIKQFYAWQATDHAGAYASLLLKGQHENPQCLACHVTGFRMARGYDPGKKVAPGGQGRPIVQRALQGVGCECCHGGSRRHLGVALKDRALAVAAPQLRARPALRACRRCHTGERPCLAPGTKDGSDMGQYLRKIKHWVANEFPADF